jgi:hypothetical protein
MTASRNRPETLRLPLGLRTATGSARASSALAAVLVVCAVIGAVAPWSAWLRASLAGVLVVLAGAVHHTLGIRKRPPLGWLVLDDEGMHRNERGRATTLVMWSEPFGVTVFGSADRATFLLALTSPRATRYLAARVRNAEDAAGAPGVIEKATTAAESDLRAGDEAALSAADAEKLLAEINRRAPSALERVYLSDAGGEAVVLDRAELRVGARRIDLSAPLEWRGFFYQELGTHAASLCQATWVRQADAELVLVAPMPADGGWTSVADSAVRAAGEGAIVQRSVARDLRLMQGPAAEPPARELRRAIDRVFMLPLRHALDRAPRAARASVPSQPMPEGRA